MNDILIVGNGYDLAKGLNTRFSDFFLPIVRQYVIWLENEFNNQNLAPDIQKYCYVLKQKIPHLPDFVVKNEDEFFNNIFIQIVLNKFFPIVNLLNSVLSINDQLFDATVSTVLSEGIAYSPYYDNKDINFIVTNIREVCSLLQDNIISSDIFWLDIESLIKDIVTDNLTKYPVNSDININWNLLYETVNRIESKTNLTKNKTEDLKKYKHVSLSECLLGLDMFKELFCEYLEIEENKYKSGKSKEIYLKDKFSHVISLNYTSTFMNSLKSSVPYKRQEDRICYVHGDRVSKNIVIGTESFYFEENSRSETNIEKIPFFKFFQKVLNKTDDKYLQWLVEDEFSLTFFGFSFSQNDFDFIRELIIYDDGNSSSTNHGQVRKELKSIIIYCKTEKDKFHYLVNLAACLGKKHLSSIKGILHFEPIK
ncbi:Bacteriophage abortive infection AbiH [Succinivibrio dextrinosolvens DSM 3072]|uniref:Bacteriophage abortive infection AbiH n=1 Tax=Succinivibrio dextrinosolvens DSM 3072 TaxID=1123324 RepID=A0A1T4VIB2_9GAMM|nr:AbiH family protein [Succinivibrio dextrinosolvens]SKA64311.1 Bacteriophage abortive infection AbiH [Succinivibrio dextrinosolvens DSM 3072]